MSAAEGRALLTPEAAGGGALSLGAEDGRMNRLDNAMSAKTSMTAGAEGRGKIVARALGRVCRNRAVGLAARGRSAIRRAAIAPAGRCAAGSSGSVAINAANLCVAASLGNRANLAASCQGSTSNRVRAERTLSSLPFL